MSPVYGKEPEIDLWPFTVAVLCGTDTVFGTEMAKLMSGVFIFSAVLYVLQYLPLMAGYVMCLIVPDRFGTRFQLKVLLALAFVNALVVVAFMLLPMLGAHRYVNLPFLAPEVAMMEMNGERTETLVTAWLHMPLLDVFSAVLMTFLQYLEPALIATFVHAVGKAIKSDDLEAGGLIAIKLAFSQIFIRVVWLMASLCGTSLVLLWALRAIYLIGVGFFIGQMIYTVRLLLGIAAVVEDQLGDEADSLAARPKEDDEEDDDEDEEDDEEEEDE